jgi:ABC-2 type transport system ATP-binding protein
MDEAERCHRLAILSRGRLVAEGEPETLMDSLPLHVVEVLADDTEGARQALRKLPAVRSLAQLGMRLHVLLDRVVADPSQAVEDALRSAHIAGRVEATRPSLEDVFVAATLSEQDMAAREAV